MHSPPDLEALFERPAFIRPAEASILADRRIGLTGANGVLGRLISDRFNGTRTTVNAFTGDIRDAASLARWIGEDNFDAIIHLAAVVATAKAIADPVATMAVNASGIANLLGSLASSESRPWVFLASTSHVYSASEKVALNEDSRCTPLSYYGATKLAAEMIARPLAAQLHVPICIGRIFSFCHETQASEFLVPNLADRLCKADKRASVEILDADAVRDFLYAGWVVDAILHLAQRRVEGTINIASGTPVTVGEIAGRIGRMVSPTTVLTMKPSTRHTHLVADVSRLASAIGTSHAT